LSKVAVIFAVLSDDGNVRNTALSFLEGLWKGFEDPTQRQVLDLARSLDPTGAQGVRRRLVLIDLQRARDERQSMSERARLRVSLVIEHRDCLPPDSLEGIFIEALEVNQIDALKAWLELFRSHANDFDLEFKIRVGTRSLELVHAGRYDQNYSALLLSTVVDAVRDAPVEQIRELVIRYFELLKSENANIRNAAADVLDAMRRAYTDTTELRIRLGGILSFVEREVSDQQLNQFHPVVSAVLNQKDLFEEAQLRDAANLAQRLLAHSDTSLHAFGLAVVESIPENPNGFSADLIHLLIAIENSGSASAGRATQELNRISAFALSEPACEALGQRGSHPAE
jgi:hypothetical protein